MSTAMTRVTWRWFNGGRRINNRCVGGVHDIINISQSRHYITTPLPTEGRESIRESLRIFACVTSSLTSRHPNLVGRQNENDVSSSSSFEGLCSKSNGLTNMKHHMSCGNTMTCFASLFLPPRDTQGLVSGSPLFQLVNNLNIVMYSFWRHLILPWQRKKQGFDSCSSSCRCRDDDGYEARRRFSMVGQAVGKFTSIQNLKRLEKKLMNRDEAHKLPRVFFCSLTWLTPGYRYTLPSTSTVLNDDDKSDEEDCHDDDDDDDAGVVGSKIGLILDHQFAIVKHSNDRFQIVQGHIPTNADDGGLQEAQNKHQQPLLPGRYSLSSFTPGHAQSGFGLIGWMQSNLGIELTSFQRDRMRDVLTTLVGFAKNQRFDANGYEGLFGVRHAGGQRYWPAISHRELTDDFIHGYGHRHVANDLEKILLDQKDEKEDDDDASGIECADNVVSSL